MNRTLNTRNHSCSIESMAFFGIENADFISNRQELLGAPGGSCKRELQVLVGYEKNSARVAATPAAEAIETKIHITSHTCQSQRHRPQRPLRRLCFINQPVESGGRSDTGRRGH